MRGASPPAIFLRRECYVDCDFFGAVRNLGRYPDRVRISLEGGWNRDREGEAPPIQAMPMKEQAGLKLHSASKPSVKQAFSDLWKEILKGA